MVTLASNVQKSHPPSACKQCPRYGARDATAVDTDFLAHGLGGHPIHPSQFVFLAPPSPIATLEEFPGR